MLVCSNHVRCGVTQNLDHFHLNCPENFCRHVVLKFSPCRAYSVLLKWFANQVGDDSQRLNQCVLWCTSPRTGRCMITEKMRRSPNVGPASATQGQHKTLNHWTHIGWMSPAFVGIRIFCEDHRVYPNGRANENSRWATSPSDKLAWLEWAWLRWVAMSTFIQTDTYSQPNDGTTSMALGHYCNDASFQNQAISSIYFPAK